MGENTLRKYIEESDDALNKITILEFNGDELKKKNNERKTKNREQWTVLYKNKEYEQKVEAAQLINIILKILSDNGVSVDTKKIELKASFGKFENGEYFAKTKAFSTDKNKIVDHGISTPSVFNAIDVVLEKIKIDHKIPKSDFVFRSYKERTREKYYTLTITANEIISSDPEYQEGIYIDNQYDCVDTYYIREDNEDNVIRASSYPKAGTAKQRIMFELFEDKIKELSVEKRHEFPVSHYATGIWDTYEEAETQAKTTSGIQQEFKYNDYHLFSHGIFSCTLFVKECLDRWGSPGDKVVMIYKDKPSKGNVSKANDEISIKNKSLTVNSLNTIFYGPPGTGKTRLASIEAVRIVSGEDYSDEVALGILDKDNDNYDEDIASRIKLVQFFPGYSYNDFVETIDVTASATEGGKDNYKDGIFKSLAKKAAEDKDNKYVLIIDEINRANVSDVFGELLYGLEYREKNISTSISNTEFMIPDNLYIIGTMNTADKSLQTMDYAIRRRFVFEQVPSKCPEPTEDIQQNEDFYKIAGEKYFYKKIFDKVRMDVEKSVARGVEPEDVLPGISYFIVNDNGKGPDIEHLKYKINCELIPLLKEYVKDGLFTKREKVEDNKTLIELLGKDEYVNGLMKND